MSDAALRLDDIACVRGGRMLFRGLSLDLRAGEALVLKGPNGAGKSSLIRVAAGLLRAFSGRVERVGAVAMSDENLALALEAPLERALGFWARTDGRDGQAVAVALGELNLAELSDIPVRMLSTGQRKRAMLARVVASGAPIWLLDEPANGLDAASEALLGAVMQRHLAGGGIILAASHQALPLADAAVLNLQDYAVEPVEA